DGADGRQGLQRRPESARATRPQALPSSEHGCPTSAHGWLSVEEKLGTDDFQVPFEEILLQISTAKGQLNEGEGGHAATQPDLRPRAPSRPASARSQSRPMSRPMSARSRPMSARSAQ
ncbi:unnamed protein product, partial [Polarella glacialis]